MKTGRTGKTGFRTLLTGMLLLLLAGVLSVPGRAQSVLLDPERPGASAWESPGEGGPSAAQDGSGPGARGQLAVTRAEYNFGFTALNLPGFPGPVELIASVHHPTDLSQGPYPLLLFLHGMHATATDGREDFVQWPPSAGRAAIASFRGYDYLASHLASYGFIVVSVSANGINAVNNRVPDVGMLARAQLLQTHLELWRIYNTQGGNPFGTRFVGKVDLTRVGTMGHSRGGEGVARHYLYNLQQTNRYGIRAILPLAPTNFTRFRPNGVALGVLLPYCDGDADDLQGVLFFDDTRYNLNGDPAPRHTFLVMGANHNFFNTVWSPSSGLPSSVDDWFNSEPRRAGDPAFGTGPGTQKLSETQQRAVGLAYMTAFFVTYVGGNSRFQALMRGEAGVPASAGNARVYTSYHPEDDTRVRRDVNRLLTASHLSRNHLGAGVGGRGLSPYGLAGGEPPQPRHVLNWPKPDEATPVEPHTTVSVLSPNQRGLSQLVTGWSSSQATWQNDLTTAVSNISRHGYVQFRAGVIFADRRNPAGSGQDFMVTLVDRAGNEASTRAAFWSPALFYPPGRSDVVPKLFLNTVRVPLRAFPGVQLTQVRSVRLDFNQNSSGAVLLTDLAFTGSGPPLVGQLQGPRSVTFPRTRRGRSVVRRITLGNGSGNEQLSLRVLRPRAPFGLLLNGTPVQSSILARLDPGSRLNVDVTFTPTRRGRSRANLTVLSSAVPRASIALAGRGR